jgi:hypothetical protein
MQARFSFSFPFLNRIEKIVGKKFTRGGEKIFKEAIDILENKIKELEKEK